MALTWCVISLGYEGCIMTLLIRIEGTGNSKNYATNLPQGVYAIAASTLVDDVRYHEEAGYPPSRQPVPDYDDGLRDTWGLLSNKEEWCFAFKDTEQMRKWFPVRVLSAKMNGADNFLCVGVYDVDECYIGECQCIFHATGKVKRLASFPVTTTDYELQELLEYIEDIEYENESVQSGCEVLPRTFFDVIRDRFV